MTAREQLLREIEDLDDSQVKEVEEFLAFLRFRSRYDAPVVFDRAQAAEQYRESAADDRQMAEEGLADYTAGLKREDAV
jgi:hypothetical protein